MPCRREAANVSLEKDQEELEAVGQDASNKGLETAIFGILFTLSKEKVDDGVLVSLLKLIIDPLQLLLILVSPRCALPS